MLIARCYMVCRPPDFSAQARYECLRNAKPNLRCVGQCQIDNTPARKITNMLLNTLSTELSFTESVHSKLGRIGDAVLIFKRL